MAGEWKTVSLDSLIEPGRGISYGIVQPGAPVTDGVPIVRVSDVRDGRIAVSAPLRVAPAIEAAYARTRLAGGELLLTLVGTVGEAAIAPASLAGWNTARAVAVIPVRKEIGAYWVKLALQAPGVREIIDSRLNTTVQATLNLGDVAQLPIVLPPISERQAIAHILGTLDEKIELNRRMNETLEAMARALFKSWFVDFDPVRAKAEGRDPGLPKPLADLFPACVVDSELGEIPEGWGPRTVEEVCRTVTRGVTPTYEEGTRRYIINQRVNRGAFLDMAELKELASDLEVPSERYARRWDVLVNCLGEGTLGRVHLFRDESDTYAVDQHMSICRGATAATGAYLYQVLASPVGQERIEGLKSGSTGMTMFNISKLRGFELLWPGAALTEAYFGLAQPGLTHVGENEAQSRTLAALRDTLLPRLITGELRVGDAEKFIGRAV